MEMVAELTQADQIGFRASLGDIFAQLSDKQELLKSLVAAHEREQRGQRSEMNNNHYIFALVQADQLIKCVCDLVDKRHPLLRQIEMLMDMPHSPPLFRVPTALKVRSVAFGSYWSQKFLGRFEDLFDDPKENPLPSWRAINWIVEDYGLSRTEQLSWANVYRATVDSTWTVDPPPAVATNIHFCACERRFKWEQGATIDSVEYNWPKIPGQFDTSTHCAEAYKKFWEMHKTHTDPVCYRAAIFCNFLVKMCELGVIINVNQFDSANPEFHLDVKLRYHLTRWKRMIELMAMTHFLYGSNGCFVNGFTTTKIALDKWLKRQELGQTKPYQEDEQVKKESIRLRAIELKREQRDRDNMRNATKRINYNP